jgi:hypothetical protein
LYLGTVTGHNHLALIKRRKVELTFNAEDHIEILL